MPWTQFLQSKSSKAKKCRKGADFTFKGKISKPHYKKEKLSEKQIFRLTVPEEKMPREVNPRVSLIRITK